MKWLGAVSAFALYCSPGAQAAAQPIRLSVGEDASIELDENPSTGYVWRIDFGRSSNLAILRIHDEGFFRSESKRERPLVGEPGVHYWMIEAISSGRARIEFVSQRPWEKRSVEHRAVSVEVR